MHYLNTYWKRATSTRVWEILSHAMVCTNKHSRNWEQRVIRLLYRCLVSERRLTEACYSIYQNWKRKSLETFCAWKKTLKLRQQVVKTGRGQVKPDRLKQNWILENLCGNNNCRNLTLLNRSGPRWTLVCDIFAWHTLASPLLCYHICFN